MSEQNISVSTGNRSEPLGGRPKKRRFATALENDDPNRVIGIGEYAEIVGVSVASIRRWIDPNNAYYDSRLIVRDHKKGAPYRWLRSDATTYRDLRLGISRKA